MLMQIQTENKLLGKIVDNIEMLNTNQRPVVQS